MLVFPDVNIEKAFYVPCYIKLAIVKCVFASVTALLRTSELLCCSSSSTSHGPPVPDPVLQNCPHTS
jgi:hypothetical protein